jgi:phosphohistidine phosphatase
MTVPKTYILWSSTAKRAADTALIFSQNLLAPIDSIVLKKIYIPLTISSKKKLLNLVIIHLKSNSFLATMGAITDFVNKFGDVYI